eukprot:TRINITY_DN1280_c0_g3_i1.p1 TRINITY_DN1280_c0_g3~~TRINITY_DN1280_c0_g3_i1.p1  ORF type:complete len:586 (+),score=89.90 TRINITY_DN1280_c0_g3_i1:143-1759(+)
MASEPLDPSSWRFRASNIRSNPVPPPSHLHALPPQQALPLSSPAHYNLRPPSQIPAIQPPIAHTTPPPTLTPVHTPTLAPTAANIRKRQYRFSVSADIGLLRLVAEHNPYGAPHGGRLQKWQNIADTLRMTGINVDFRRARDRTALLIEQWRKQEFSLLRRSGSGNQHDQAQKERLLDVVSNMEHAAKPRDNLSEWRPRDNPTRLPSHNPSVLVPDVARKSESPDTNSQRVAISTCNTENEHSAPAPLAHIADVNAPTVSRPISVTHPFSASLAPAVITVASVGSNMPSVSPPNSNAASRHAALPPLEPQCDVLMTSETAALQQKTTPPPPPPPPPLRKSNDVKRLGQHMRPRVFGPGAAIRGVDEGRCTSESLFTPGCNTLSSLRARGGAHAMESQGVGCNVLSSTAARPTVSDQNIQLETPGCVQGRAELQGHNASGSNAHVCMHCGKLERVLQQILHMMQKKVEVDERRLEWEKQCELKRQQMQKERVEREMRERELEREERRQKDVSHKEERQRLLELIARGRAHMASGGDHPD